MRRRGLQHHVVEIVLFLLISIDFSIGEIYTATTCAPFCKSWQISKRMTTRRILSFRTTTQHRWLLGGWCFPEGWSLYHHHQLCLSNYGSQPKKTTAGPGRSHGAGFRPAQGRVIDLLSTVKGRLVLVNRGRDIMNLVNNEHAARLYVVLGL